MVQGEFPCCLVAGCLDSIGAVVCLIYNFNIPGSKAYELLKMFVWDRNLHITKVLVKLVKLSGCYIPSKSIQNVAVSISHIRITKMY
jgi:hypothetical protein